MYAPSLKSWLLMATLFLSTTALAGAPIPWFDEDFVTFAGAGFSATPAAGQLDSNQWRVQGLSDGPGSFGGEFTSGDFARGATTGGASSGGIYALSTGTAIALGAQPTGADFTPGSFDLRIVNNTGDTIEAVDISYLIWTYNDQPRANSLNFEYSLDDSNWTPVPGLDYTSPEASDGSPAWVSTPRSTTLTGLGLAVGSPLYLRWTSDDVSGGGSRDELGIGAVQVDIIPPPTLLASKTGSAFARVGDTITYNLEISNVDATETVTDVVLSDLLPGNVSYVSDTSGLPLTQPIPGIYEWDLGDLAAGQSFSFDLVVSVNGGAAGDLVNNFNASGLLGAQIVTAQAEWATTVVPEVSIYDIQTVVDPGADDASPLLGQTVFVDGIVTAAPGEIENGGVAVIQEAAGGPYSGLVIDADFAGLGLARGDEILVVGEVTELSSQTRLAASRVELLASPGELAPILLPTSDFPAALAATSEPWESVFIEFQSVEVTAELSFGEWEFDDGTGPAVGDDLGSITLSPALGDQYGFLRGIGWYSFGAFKVEPRNNDDLDFIAPLFEIYEIQGEGLRSPLAPATGNGTGAVVRSEDNIVTAVTADAFTIQMPDERDSSAMPLASRGLYVYTGSAPTVQVGDRVNVQGAVVEFFDLTQIGFPDAVEILDSGNPLPTATLFDAGTPSSDPTTPSCGVNNFECFESMRVTVPNGFVTAPSQNFVSDPVAEAVVSAGGDRVLRGPGVEFPGLGGACPGCPVWSGAPERFELDPDRVGLPNVTLAGGTSFSAIGVIGYDFGDYELWPTELTIDSTPPLPVPAPASGPTELSIASLNALDLFDDVDDPDRPIPTCDAGYIASNRVVLSPAEYQLKLAKLADTITQGLNFPDVIALQEVESLTTLQDLADAISAARGFTYTPYLVPGNDRGEINNGFLVAESRVAVDAIIQEGGDECLSSDNTPLHDRPTLTLEARFIANGENWPFVVMNNHFRSLGGIDSDARVRLKRHEQAQSVAARVQARQSADPLLPIILVGDKNAFQFSDGYVDLVGLLSGTSVESENLVNLENAGVPGFDPSNQVIPSLVNPLLTLPASERYSFIFQGVAQTLDHALLNRAAELYFSNFGYMRGNADYWEGFAEDELSVARSSDHDGFVLVLEPGRDIDALFEDRFESP
ncbi:endonuclease/exonuclease/phosphatase family protein [Wenzhouxiangella marina]|uniref:Uncharacterized protein n=1 Tax=Wenzhouxiangella marina TaxID=1579979 RepID=A0A0K0XSU2_9GAMM|nr:DUF11 domain-containing protein [Wenzhouxiangella marina]AKS40784.1 hypothetical protein WM2015_401 [Wenzhouxiangella marina]MBB6087657.1 hypothetical protein [Wenzhouxiangella marina]